MYVTVKVGRLPGKITEIALNSEKATVVEALKGAKLEKKKTEELRVNGDVAKADTVLSSGDVVLLAKKIKGN